MSELNRRTFYGPEIPCAERERLLRFFFFSSRRRHTRLQGDWSSDVCSSDLNRDDLLAGAKKCLLEKGYSRTTARDIAAASGVSLAAIGYHFGSKDALMNAAMMEAIGEWGDEVENALDVEMPDASPVERFEAIWERAIRSFAEHRQLWMASFEMMAQAEHNPQIREYMLTALRLGRLGLAKMFLRM